MQNVEILSENEVLSAANYELKRLWSKHKIGGRFPEYLSLIYLRKLVYYKLQEKQHGQLPIHIEQQLIGKRANANENSVSRKVTKSNITAGTILKRHWNGRDYEVTVLDKGYIYQGNTYRSLSKVAKEITGAHWSGPLFFGIKKQVRTDNKTKAA